MRIIWWTGNATSGSATSCAPALSADAATAAHADVVGMKYVPRDEMNGTQENLSGGNQMREEFVGPHLAQPQATLSISGGCPSLANLIYPGSPP